MKTIGQVLRNRPGSVIRVRPTESVLRALELMAQHDVSAVLVMEEAELLGILTERDYAQKVTLTNKVMKTIRVSEIMTQCVFCATPYMTIDHAMSLASERNVRHLPVIDIGKGVVGLVSTRDLIREKFSLQLQ